MSDPDAATRAMLRLVEAKIKANETERVDLFIAKRELEESLGIRKRPSSATMPAVGVAAVVGSIFEEAKPK